jgi:hypothetical protein
MSVARSCRSFPTLRIALRRFGRLCPTVRRLFGLCVRAFPPLRFQYTLRPTSHLLVSILYKQKRHFWSAPNRTS